MKFNILNIIFLFVTVFTFVGCDEWEDTETVSDNYDDDSAVRFIDDNSSEIILNLSDLSFSLTVIRDNPTSSLDVPVTVVTNGENMFIVPSTVSFEAGQDTTELVISLDASASFDEPYLLELEFGEDYFNNPYKIELPTYSGYVTLINLCPLTSIEDLEGQWYGDDSFWESIVGTEVIDGELVISGISEPMMVEWWGETIVERDTVVMTIGLETGTVDIPRQSIYTADYNGEVSQYEIIGSGKWDNCGDVPTLVIDYDIYYEGEDSGLAADYAPGGVTVFTATLTKGVDN